MTTRTVAVELLAKVSGYTAGMSAATKVTLEQAAAFDTAAKAEKRFEATQSAAQKSATATAAAQRRQLDSMRTVGRGFLTLGAVAGVGLGAAVKASLDFNKQLQLVATLAKTSPAQTRALGDAALTVGQKYGYTATQVAEAQAELVKAGISVKDVLGGALTGTLTLAAAAQTDVATATEIAASAMTQFQLSAKDVPHIADLLAAGADKALGSATDLGDALSQVGTTAHQFGFSIDDTVGTLAAFAQAGQIGQKAGTDLNQVLLQLAAPTKQAQDLMTKYGLSLYDANGRQKTFAQIAGNLQQSFSTLTPAVRNQALAVIFGSRAIKGANILYAEGQAGIEGWSKKIEDNGFAAQQASGKLDNLAGDLQKLKAAFTTGLIETGNQSQSALRDVAQAATAIIDAFNSLGPGAKTLIIDLTGVVTVTGLAGGAALFAIPKYVQFRNALAELGLTARTTSVALGEEAAAARVAGAANGAAAASSGGRLATLGKVAGPLALLATGLLVGKQSIDASVSGRVQSQTDALANDPAKLAAARVRQAQLASQLKALQQTPVVAGKGGAGAVAGNVAALQGQYDTLTKEIKAATAAANGNAAANAAAAPPMIKLGGSAGAAAVDVTALGAALDDAAHRFDVAAGTDQLADGFAALKKQVHESSAAVTGNTAAARANREALRSQYGVALNIITAYANQKDAAGNLVHSQKDVQTEARRVAAAFQNGADKAGIGKRKTDDYAAALRNVPKSISTTLSVTANLTNAERAVGVLQGQVNKLAALRAADVGPGKGPGKARGGLLDGPGTGTSDSIPIRASKGEFIVNARATAANLSELHQINSETPAYATGGMVGMGQRRSRFATGGQVGAFAGNIDTSLIQALFGQSYSTASDVADARHSRTVAINAVKDAEAALRKERAKAHPDMEKIHADERRLVADRQRVDATTRSLSKVEASYRQGKKPLADRYASAVATAAQQDSKFLANLKKLNARGFGLVAAELYAEGDDGAKIVAAQMVTWSDARLNSVQRNEQAGATAVAGLSALFGGASGTSITAGLPVAQGQGPTIIYVENPWTGEYLMGKTNQQINSAFKTQNRQLASGVRL